MMTFIEYPDSLKLIDLLIGVKFEALKHSFFNDIELRPLLTLLDGELPCFQLYLLHAIDQLKLLVLVKTVK